MAWTAAAMSLAEVLDLDAGRDCAGGAPPKHGVEQQLIAVGVLRRPGLEVDDHDPGVRVHDDEVDHAAEQQLGMVEPDLGEGPRSVEAGEQGGGRGADRGLGVHGARRP